MTGALRQFTAPRQAAGEFSPADLPGLSLWLDADDAATITDTAGQVTKWDDKSGNSYDLTKTAGSNVKTGDETLNGRNVITHLGSARFRGTWPVIGTACTWFVVWDVDGPQSKFVVVSTSDGSDLIGAADAGSTSTTVVGNMGTPSLHVDGAPLSPSTRGELHSRMVGKATVFAATGVVYEESIYQTSYEYFDTFFMDGGLAEVVVYSGSLSSTDRATVEAYLADKWGITL